MLHSLGDLNLGFLWSLGFGIGNFVNLWLSYAPLTPYVALDARGQESTGLIEANSSNEAIGQLRQAGYFPTNVFEEGKAAGRDGKAVKAKKVKTPCRAESSRDRQEEGHRPLRAQDGEDEDPHDLHAPARDTHRRGASVAARADRAREAGARQGPQENDRQFGRRGAGRQHVFSEGLAQHPRIFNKLYINMVRAGEVGGVLELVLNRLAEFQEKAQKIKNKVVAAMVYPMIVMFLAISIMAFLLVFIVPRFEQIFKDMLGDKPLPTITLFVIAVSNGIKNHWAIILGVIALLVVGFKLLGRTKGGRAALDRVKLHAPLFGDLIRKTSISRFSRTLGTLVTSGVPILQALNITRETAGNTIIADAITKVHDSVKEGESIVQPLEASGAFPPMVVSMIDVGEETGQLPEMLLKIAEVYDDEVDNSVGG